MDGWGGGGGCGGNRQEGHFFFVLRRVETRHGLSVCACVSLCACVGGGGSICQESAGRGPACTAMTCWSFLWTHVTF